jgi:hypothetical protein
MNEVTKLAGSLPSDFEISRVSLKSLFGNIMSKEL